MRKTIRPHKCSRPQLTLRIPTWGERWAISWTASVTRRVWHHTEMFHSESWWGLLTCFSTGTTIRALKLAGERISMQLFMTIRSRITSYENPKKMISGLTSLTDLLKTLMSRQEKSSLINTIISLMEMEWHWLSYFWPQSFLSTSITSTVFQTLALISKEMIKTSWAK